MITCPACGAQNAQDAAYCVGCARRLDEATAQRVATVRAVTVADQATGVRWLAIVVAAGAGVIVILIVVVALVFITH